MINRRHNSFGFANGFTLVELLVAMAIVGLLTSIALVGMAGVTENARGDRTRAQIARIHSLIAPKWEELHERRTRIWGFHGRDAADANMSARLRQIFQLRSKRRLLRMALPDRRSDLLDGQRAAGERTMTPPAEWRTLRRKAVNAIAKKKGGSFNDWTEDGITAFLRNNWSTSYQSSECLYLILANTVDGDRAALEFFREDEIGDIDGDGLLEIHDAWGTPITFLRWAPGFTGTGTFQNINLPDPLDPLDIESNRWNDNPLNPADLLDNTFQLFPVIVSSGPDKKSDLVTEFNANRAIHYAAEDNNPYLRGNKNLPLHDPQQLLVGKTFDFDNDGDNSADNIHNHLISTGR